MEDKKGFGYDFLINVATVNKQKAKEELSSLYMWMDRQVKKAPIYGAVKGKLTPADITSRIEGLKGLNPEEMSKRRQKEVAKEIKGLYELRKSLVNYYDAAERGHGKMFLAMNRLSPTFKKIGTAAKIAFDVIKPIFTAIGVAILGVIGIVTAFIAVLVSAAKHVLNLFKESLALGKELEKLSFTLRPFFGSREGALKGIQFAMAQRGFDWRETVQGMKQLGEVGVDATKHMEQLKDMAAYAGKSVNEVASDLAATINGDLTGLKDYGIAVLQQFRKWQGYPEKMKGAVMGYLNSLTNRYKGMAKEWEGTWEGMMNTLKNRWDKFKMDIIGSPTDPNSLYGWVKKTLKTFLDWVDANGAKVTAIAHGIGRLFRTVASFVAELFGGIFANFDKLTEKGIAEWFIRQEAKLMWFLTKARLWIEEKLAEKSLWNRIKYGIVTVCTAVEMMSKGIIRIGQAIRLIYEIVNPFSWGADRWKNIKRDWAALTSPIGGENKKTVAVDVASNVAGTYKPRSYGDRIATLNARSAKEHWDEARYKRELKHLEGGLNFKPTEKKQEIKLEKDSEVSIGGEAGKMLKSMDKTLAQMNRFGLIDMLYKNVKDEKQRKELFLWASTGRGEEVDRYIRKNYK